MWAGLILRAACAALLLPGAPGRSHGGRKPPGHFAAERRRLGPHVCLSGFGSGCCPGWAPSMGSGHCTLPLCSFGCGSGICIAPNVCSCQDGEQGATCPEVHGPCGEYGCDLTCNHGGCQEVARVCPVGFSMTETAVGIRCTDIDECLSSSCEGQCVNTEGGFVCECGPGMQLAADRHSCQDGSVSCKRTDCVDSCPHPIRIPGQCCPDCSAGCTYTGRIFYNNQTFPSVQDPCLSCICLLGSVACSPVDCPITCTYPFHPDGECCPVCRDCNYEGRKVVNGQLFTLDDEPCTQCMCQLGEVSCEKVPCQLACLDPSEPPGDCCSSCPDSLERKAVEVGKAARSPRGDAEAPVNCSSCPGTPAALAQKPVFRVLQLLRTNLSDTQTSPMSPSGAHTSPSSPLGPRGIFPGEPGASQPSLGTLIPPRASSLPPVSPGAPGPPPVTPEPSSSFSGAQTLTRRASSPAVVLTEASVHSMRAPSPSETPAILLRPRRLSPATARLSAALVASATSSPQWPAAGTSREEESTS